MAFKLLNAIQRFVPQTFKIKLKEKLGVPSQLSTFQRLQKSGYQPKICLDIGAYEGSWATSFLTIFPDTEILMIEAQQHKQSILKQQTATYSKLDYRIALLGAAKKEVAFNIYETASSVLKENNETGALVETRTLTTLDNLVTDTIFTQADFIKIDTQGYELEILKGAKNTLQHTEFILLEVSMIDIYQNCPLIADVFEFMNHIGFVLYDICDLMRRPYDKALYQSDFLFIKHTSPLRAVKRWN
ncbi:MAG: FkbM family methyltransferase [Sphingobacteriaceae bacterium]|nr:MAG: FkbM family methyltransferase [Sphingobacteriaceae bacterium]